VPPTYYETLGVAPSATASEIRVAYVELARLHHPDAGGNDAAMTVINTAYNALMHHRAAYDRRLRVLRKICDKCRGTGRVAKSFTATKTCPTCHGSGYTDRH
jgi:DnaJ-class molecular chaperone